MTIWAGGLFPGSLHRLQVAQDGLQSLAPAALPLLGSGIGHLGLARWTALTLKTQPQAQQRCAKGLSHSEAGLLC